MANSTGQAPSAAHAQLIQAFMLAAPAAKLVFWRHDRAPDTVQRLPPAPHPFATDDQDLNDDLQPPTGRFRICRPDGRTLQLETDCVLEHDARGRLVAVAVVGTHRDVTDKAILAALARALADATLAHVERLGREQSEQPGTGLGLAVCGRLARLMGGGRGPQHTG